jgi:predicted methyltransferase
MGHHSDEPPPHNEAIARALADKDRPARDRSRDKRDQIGEVLAFASIAPGEIVADFMPFRGYYTRLFAALVGVAGRAYAVVPEELTRIERIAKGRAEIAGFAANQPTIELVSRPVVQAGALPEPVDLFWISENYHDLHNAFMAPVDIGAFNAAVFGALKPGGRLIIIDHVAAKAAPRDVTQNLHRIEPAVARREIEAAGFKWDGRSDALANPADRHTSSIFAHGIRYHTDRFINRFRKPA